MEDVGWPSCPTPNLVSPDGTRCVLMVLPWTVPSRRGPVLTSGPVPG